MSGQIQYHQTCACGASITISETYEFVSLEHLQEQFEKWQAEHSHCTPLFVEVQRARLEQLNQKLIGVTSEIQT